MKRFMLSVLIALFCTAMAQADPTLSLNPASGKVSVANGSAAGWGFSFTNDSSSNWLVLTGSDFMFSGPTYGMYNDYIANPPNLFYVIGPSTTLTEPWVFMTSGLGDFQPTDAPPGTLISGPMVVDYDTFSDDPSNGGTQIGFDSKVTAQQLAQVSVPEPSSLAMLMGMLLLPFSYRVWGRRILRAV